VSPWYFDAYFVTDHGSGWDETAYEYDTKEEAKKAAKTFMDNHEGEVENVRVYTVAHQREEEE
jgi:hypothetical protein